MRAASLGERQGEREDEREDEREGEREGAREGEVWERGLDAIPTGLAAEGLVFAIARPAGSIHCFASDSGCALHTSWPSL